MIKEVRELAYQEKHREGFARSWDGLLDGWEIVQRGSEVREGALKDKESKMYSRQSLG